MGNVRFSFEKLISSFPFSIVQEIKKHRSDVKKITAKLKNRDLRVAQLEENQLESNNLLVLTAPADNNPPTRGGKSKQLNKGGGGRGAKGAVDVSDTTVKTKKGKGADNGEERGGKGGGGKEKREKGEKEKTTNREKGEKEKSGSRGKTLTFIKQNSRSW